MPTNLVRFINSCSDLRVASSKLPNLLVTRYTAHRDADHRREETRERLKQRERELGMVKDDSSIAPEQSKNSAGPKLRRHAKENPARGDATGGGNYSQLVGGQSCSIQSWPHLPVSVLMSVDLAPYPRIRTPAHAKACG
jgi:hypothetical protein